MDWVDWCQCIAIVALGIFQWCGLLMLARHEQGIMDLANAIKDLAESGETISRTLREHIHGEEADDGIG